MAETGMGIYYPNNYGVTADIPADMKKMAESIDPIVVRHEANIYNLDTDKVDKEEGKGLSTEDFTTEEKEKLAGLSNYDDTEVKKSISQINQEQTEQNTQITALQQENTKLKNQIPQGTEEGEVITVQDSSDMEFKAFNIRGNHKQATRSGYQLVDYSREPDVLTRATYNFAEDIITVASDDAETKGQTFARYIITDIVKANAGKTLKFACGSFDFANGNGANVQLAVVYNDGTSSKYITLLSSSSNTTYTIPSDTSNIENVYFNIIVNNSSSTIGLYSITITKPMLYFGTEDKEYEQYGASPSIKYPSPIQAMGENGSVDEIVGNKNYYNKDIQYEWGYGYLTSGEWGDYTSKSWASNRYEDLPIKENTIYAITGNIVPGSWSSRFMYFDKSGNLIKYENFVGKPDSSIKFITPSRTRYFSFQVANNTNNPLEQDKIQIEEVESLTSTSTDYIPHEEQTITMPIQQPMVEVEDYIDWDNEEEVHGYKTVVLTGQEEGWNIVTSESGDGNTKIFKNGTLMTGCRPNEGIKEITSRVYCTHFKNITGTEIRNISNIGITVWDDTSGPWIRAPYTTVEEWKAWLAEQAEAGTPVEIRYHLATPTRLPFTEGQKAVKEQIKALHTYKNVTNIYSTDEVGANVEATYYKDIDTLDKNYQEKTDARLDAIEALLSTTGTSAMLLDNYQTDLESEVM